MSPVITLFPLPLKTLESYFLNRSFNGLCGIKGYIFLLVHLTKDLIKGIRWHKLEALNLLATSPRYNLIDSVETSSSNNTQIV